MKFGKKHINFQAGMSLVEVMISVTILGVVTMGAVSLGEQVATGGTMNRVSRGIQELQESIRAGTLLEEECIRYLRGADGLAAPLNYDPSTARRNGITQPGLPISFMVGNARGLDRQPISASDGLKELTMLGLEVEALELTNATFIPDGDNGPPQRYFAFLEMELSRPNTLKTLVGGQSWFQRRVVTALYLETNAVNRNVAGDVTVCRGVSSNYDPDSFCNDPDGPAGPDSAPLGPGWDLDANGDCVVPITESLECNPGEVMTGIDEGVAVCKPIGLPQPCDPGDYVTAIGIERMSCGTPRQVIINNPTGSNCTPQVVNWTVGTDNCSGNLTNTLAVDGSTVVVDTATGPTGSVTVTCRPGNALELSDAVCAPGGGGPVNGVCGPAHGGTHVDAAAANAAGLCSAGTASPASLAGAGPWNWTCQGISGGSDANCSATEGAAAPGRYRVACAGNSGYMLDDPFTGMHTGLNCPNPHGQVGPCNSGNVGSAQGTTTCTIQNQNDMTGTDGADHGNPQVEPCECVDCETDPFQQAMLTSGGPPWVEAYACEGY